MAEDDSQLRARITALGDLELARMLTLDADNYRVQALQIAKTEAERRRLDPLAFEDELRAERHRAPGKRPAPSIEQVAPIEWKRLAPLWPWLLILGSLAGLEVLLVVLGRGEDSSSRRCLLIPAMIGFFYYLRGVDGLHEVLQRATGGRYPITRMAALVWTLIPFVNFVWPFGWGAWVSRFAERNGSGRVLDRHLPGVFCLAGVLMQVDITIRMMLLCATITYPQLRLKHSMRGARLEQGDAAEWSSRSQA